MMIFFKEKDWGKTQKRENDKLQFKKKNVISWLLISVLHS